MEHFIGIDAGGWLDKAVTLVVAVAIALVIQRVVVRLMHKVLDASDLPSASLFINIVRAVIWALALLSVMRPVFGVDPAGFVAALGVVSIAVSLGMQDTISNIIGGISLMLSKAVQPGDLISVGDVTGEVTDVTWRSTTVRMRGGAEGRRTRARRPSRPCLCDRRDLLGLHRLRHAGGGPPAREARRGLLHGPGSPGARPLRQALARECAVGSSGNPGCCPGTL